MHIPDDQYTEEYTVIGAEASKEISQTNQNTDNAMKKFAYLCLSVTENKFGLSYLGFYFAHRKLALLY
jgi:putative methionine-R-sulfoxide reductase with GAF domain